MIGIRQSVIVVNVVLGEMSGYYIIITINIVQEITTHHTALDGFIF